jgi:hypothetical protein
MKFEHVIQVNDLANPMVTNLTREQLWRGLVLRAETPKYFMEHVDECVLSEKTIDSVQRVLRYGDVKIRDTVTFLPLIQVHYHVPVQGELPASQLRMVIEEPETDALFVRFVYEDDVSQAEDDAVAFYNDFRRSAYQEADVETIRKIRELAEQGQLG